MSFYYAVTTKTWCTPVPQRLGKRFSSWLGFVFWRHSRQIADLHWLTAGAFSEKWHPLPCFSSCLRLKKESHNGRKARSSGSKKWSFQSFLCSTTWDPKSTEIHSSYGDSCFLLWADIAMGSDGTYPAADILSHMAVYLKLWRAQPKSHWKQGELCPLCAGGRAGSKSLREGVWGLWVLLLWAGTAVPSCTWWRRAAHTQCDHSQGLYCHSWNPWYVFPESFLFLMTFLVLAVTEKHLEGKKHIPVNLRTTGADL